jgi:hypothetical protein
VTSTGFRAPSANAPGDLEGWDNNGYEGSLTNAYAAGILSPPTETALGTELHYNMKDKHLFHNYLHYPGITQ